MKTELIKKLLEKYPWMRPLKEYGCSNFPVGDGWYGILDIIGDMIKNAIELENSCVELYKKDRLHGKEKHWTWKPDDKKFDYPVVYQIKNKLGGLRFYIGNCPDYNKQFRYDIQEQIHMAESLSFIICEECGNKGKLRKNMFVQTLCDSCYEKTKKK